MSHGRQGGCEDRVKRLPRLPLAAIRMERKASAQWNGGLKDGKGTVSTASGAVKGVPYTFAMRFGDTQGTNPEELVGGACGVLFDGPFRRTRAGRVSAGTH